MRVIILYNTSWYVYLLRRNLIRALQHAGCDVTVVAPPDGYTDRVKQLGVAFAPISLSPSSAHPINELSTVVELHKVLSRLKPDAVLSFTIKCNLYAGLCQRLQSYRLIANVSGLGETFTQPGILRIVVKSLYRMSLGKSHRIFFQNSEDRELCVTSKLVPPRNSEVIPGSGVDTIYFTPVTKRASPSRTFLMFGRLLPQKGFQHFLEAARILRAELGDIVHFWILGTPDVERAESLKLLSSIREAHRNGTVRYLESSDNVLPIIHDSDVVVLPSTYNEGVPRSLLESLACGKPIVTTDWKGCRETVQHGKNGYLVRPNDLDSLVRALRSLATCPPEQLAKFGAASRLLAEQRFDERNVLDAYLRALDLLDVSKDQLSDQTTHPAFIPPLDATSANQAVGT